MVKVKGFPGPLWPPDDPRGPSPDSDFVLALKRTLARIGAWPWDPGGWDDSYSNLFAHGDGWDDLTHAGIEGIQHWAGNIVPSGNVGEQTFNFLRSVRVPQGRTHGGEMAMDSVAVNLTNAAYEDAHASSGKTVREAALAWAIEEIGTKEHPPDSNLSPYGDWYGEQGVPWCAIFVTCAYELGARGLGKDSPTFLTLTESGGAEDRYDYCPWLVSDARNGRHGLSVTTSPRPGSLIAYDWDWNDEYDHVGIFESGDRYFWTAIEGNTSPEGSSGSQSNGGQVCRRERNANQASVVFINVAEP